jgi:hypothetical protein
MRTLALIVLLAGCGAEGAQEGSSSWRSHPSENLDFWPHGRTDEPEAAVTVWTDGDMDECDWCGAQ